MATLSDSVSRSGLRIGDWVVRPDLNQLTRGDAVTRLRPKVMDVLAFLAARPGEVIGKDEILDAVWAKKFLGDSALARAVFELREVLGDDPQHPAYIETIPKRGYRLVAPVEPCQATAEAPAAGVRRRGARRPAVVATAVALLLVAAVVALAMAGRRGSSAVPRPPARIVALPFENLGAPSDAYFAAGVTDEIAGRLVAVPEIVVISPSSAARAAGSRPSPDEVGRELGVDYVLGGTVRWERGGGQERVRVTPKLVRVSDRTQVWAAVYDRVPADIFSIQSEIARRVITEIGVAVNGRAGALSGQRPTASLEAYDAFLRGNYHAATIYRSEADLRLGLQMYERATELDPSFATAWSATARVRAILFHLGFDRHERSRAEGRRALDRALGLDAGAARVHLDAGSFYYWCERDYERALDEFSLARSTGGDSASLRSAEGFVFRRQGRWQDALRSFEAAAALDPRGWEVARELGITSLYLRRYADAERHLQRAIALAPDEPEPYGTLAETYWGWRGDTKAAGAVLAVMPRPREARQAWWLFWQRVYEGSPELALADVRRGAFEVIDGSENWGSRRLLAARALWMLGRTGEAGAEFGAVRRELEPLIAERPDDFTLHSTLGLCLAGQGRRDEAIREGRRAVELVTSRGDRVAAPTTVIMLAEIYALAGEPQAACAQLGAALRMPGVLSPARLRLDPVWASLRSRPCFAALAAAPEGDVGTRSRS